MTGALSEAPVPGSVLGPTFLCLLGRTFRNIRLGRPLDFRISFLAILNGKINLATYEARYSPCTSALAGSDVRYFAELETGLACRFAAGNEQCD